MIDFSYKRIKAILIKELIQLKRDRTTLAMMLMFPVVQLLLFGYAINTDPKHLPTIVISKDNSIFARNIVAGLNNSEYFSINPYNFPEETAHRLLKEGKAQFVINIPENFTKNLIKQNRPSILLEADATDPTATNGAISSIEEIVKRALEKDGTGELSMAQPTASPTEVIIHRKYNPEGFSRYNIVPGLMGIILTMTGIIMTALALTRERERGTMENLLSMPATPLEVMAGKILPYIMIGYIQSFVILLVAKYLFSIPIIGSIFLLSSILIMFIGCNLAIGFSISSVAKNQLQAMQMAMMTILPSILLSGFMFPFRGMPLWAQYIGSMIPTTYFIRIARGIVLKGNNIHEIWTDVWPLIIFLVIISSFTIKFYKKTLD